MHYSENRVILLKEMAGEEVEVVRVMDLKTLGSAKTRFLFEKPPATLGVYVFYQSYSSNSANEDQMMGKIIMAGHISECEV